MSGPTPDESLGGSGCTFKNLSKQMLIRSTKVKLIPQWPLSDERIQLSACAEKPKARDAITDRTTDPVYLPTMVKMRYVLIRWKLIMPIRMKVAS